MLFINYFLLFKFVLSVMTILVSDGLNEYQTPARANEFFKFVITNSIPSDGNGGCKSDIKKRPPMQILLPDQHVCRKNIEPEMGKFYYHVRRFYKYAHGKKFGVAMDKRLSLVIFRINRY